MSLLTVIMILLTAAIVVIGRLIYEHNRDVKKCNALADKAESKSVPKYEGSGKRGPTTAERTTLNLQPDVRPIMSDLSHYTGTTVTRITRHHCDVFLEIEFTFMYNDYVRQHAVAKVQLFTKDMLECEAACVNAIMNKKFKTSPNWNY